jgi:hypothetical protein
LVGGVVLLVLEGFGTSVWLLRLFWYLPLS